MTREEFNQKAQSLIQMVGSEHQANASELLTALMDSYRNSLEQADSLTSDIAKMRENNETLRRVNADLFLKVGSTSKKEEPTPVEQPTETILPFELLFNANGELK